MGKLIKRIPGSRLLISSLPGSALRKHVEHVNKNILYYLYNVLVVTGFQVKQGFYYFIKMSLVDEAQDLNP